MEITTIFFDLGRVLVNYSFKPSIQKTSENSPYSYDELFHFFKNDSKIIEYETGEISTEEFFSHLHQHSKYQGTPEELQKIWVEIFTPIEDHILLAHKLAPHYHIGLISNTADAHITYLQNLYHFFDIFKVQIYSHQVHLRKPDPKIYTTALERMQEVVGTPLDKYQTLFIDDLEENVLTPSKMGWQTIHLRPDVNLRTSLQSYELKGAGVPNL